MNITVNGTARDTAPLTVAALVADETGSTETAGVAVAVNSRVVPASAWDTELTDGDVVDILTATQGG